MKKVERVELVLENCEVFEIREEDIGFIEVTMAPTTFHVYNGGSELLRNKASDVFFEVSKIYGTFVFSDDFVEGEDYIVKPERLTYMDITSMVFHYDDGSEDQIYVPFNETSMSPEYWQMSNDMEQVLVTDSAIYVLIGEGKIEDRVTGELKDTANYRISSLSDGVEDVRDVTFEEMVKRSLEIAPVYIHPVSEEERKAVENNGMEGLHEKMEKENKVHEAYINSDRAKLVGDVLSKLRAIPVEDIKVGGRVAYVNRQGDVVAEYVTDISGEFVGLRSGNVIHHTQVTALVAG